MTFFNTENSAGRELKEHRHQADSQERKIAAFFDEAAGFLYTPSEIRTKVFSNSVPITSVRRAMTNLTTENLLVKTEQKHAGEYGRRECCWRRKIGTPAQQELFSRLQSRNEELYDEKNRRKGH